MSHAGDSHGDGHRNEETSGIAQDVANHYNALPERGLDFRKDSRIFHMRNFNNWTKSMLIKEAISQVRNAKSKNRSSHQSRADQITVLDIGCGKGGDLLKYKKGGIFRLICTDIAETSLDQCHDRYKKMVTEDNRFNRRFSRDRMFESEFICADSTRDRLSDKFRDPRIEIDLVSVQFVLHYSFESLAQAERMLRNISENLSVGGFWVGTTTDADQLVTRARRANSRQFGNEVYSVTFADDAVLHEDQRLPLFGSKYDFHLEGVVDCPEFLVHFPTLEHMALRYGLRRAIKQNFAEFYKDQYATRDGAFLLRKMTALERIPPSGGRARASDSAGEYDHLNDQQEGDPPVGTLSRSEWEAITLYCVFAFQKFREIDGEEGHRSSGSSGNSSRERSDDRHGHEDRKRHRSPDRDANFTSPSKRRQY